MSRQMIPVVIVLLAALVAGSTRAPGRPDFAAAHASPAAGTPCPATTEVENEALVHLLYEEAWGQGRLEVLDEVLAADYVHHVPRLGGWLPVAQAPAPGRTVMAESIREFRTDFPDVRYTIQELVASEDAVAARMTVAGTQADPLETWDAPDTGRRMDRQVWVFFRVACGKLSEGWALLDNLTMLRQLGIVTDEELADAGTPTVAAPVP
jgi:predicted ester cyclase